MSDFPDDVNGDVLRSLERDGDDLSKPRNIDFSVIFMDESSAEKFVELVRDEDVTVELDCGLSDDRPWDVTVTRFMIPTHQGVTEMESRLEKLATPLGGRNDGWGCFSVIN